jgi:hypothetical protein
MVFCEVREVRRGQHVVALRHLDVRGAHGGERGIRELDRGRIELAEDQTVQVDESGVRPDSAIFAVCVPADRLGVWMSAVLQVFQSEVGTNDTSPTLLPSTETVRVAVALTAAE